ncbi:MAG: BrnT family toxin [Bacteroidota bacterium]|jgi:uncharacterized DUF497 family protein
MQVFPEFEGFDWDEANQSKNWGRHKVQWWECEEVFFNQPLYVYSDQRHSKTEDRFYALGKTNQERLLFIVFTRRKNNIRIISARDMHKKERNVYLEKVQKDSNI